MAGAFYIWIMAAFFITLVGVMGLLFGVMWIGHWLEKKETGAKHGFLELPHELRGKLPPDDADPPNSATHGDVSKARQG